MNEDSKNVERNSDPQGRNEAVVMCACYPNHCEHGDSCWCEPRVEIVDGGGKIVIHNEGH